MEHQIFGDILTILGLSAVALLVCHRLRVPTIVGFLGTGLIAGPSGFALIEAVEEVEELAEIGVVLLLFTIGIEFSLSSLRRIRWLVLVGGGLQLAGTIAAAAVVVRLAGAEWNQAIFAGFLLGPSSTAIVLKLLHQHGAMGSLHGRFSTGVLILQDLAIVPLLLAVPLLGGADGSTAAFLPILGQGALILLLVVAAARWVLPGVLHRIAAARDAELFQVSVVVLGFGIAYLTASAGLSLAVGAFLAGLVLSESPYAHRALGNLLPLRDLFMSFFFVSVGMLFDAGGFAERFVPIIGFALLAIVGKAILTTAAALAARIPLDSALRSGLALAQVGEFSFLLAEAGLDHALIGPGHFQTLLGASALSMMTTPFLIAAAPRLAEMALRLPVPDRVRLGVAQLPPLERLSDHLVIFGFGLVGRQVADAADAAGVTYVVVEMNNETVHRESENGRRIFIGDATQEASLRHAQIEAARVAVVALSDPAATRRAVELLRTLAPRLRLIARTHFFTELGPLLELGADEVISEEYETAIEVSTRVLASYLVPEEEIAGFAARVRASGYELMRSPAKLRPGLADLDLVLSDVEIRVLRVGDGAGAAGRSLAELNLRRDYGILVLVIRRRDEKIQLPDGDERLRAGDEAVVLGLPDLLPFAEAIFRSPA